VNLPSDAQHPTSHYWSLSVQRELEAGYLLELGYTGNRSYHLLRQGQGNPGILSGAKAAAVVANCTWANRTVCTDPAGFPTSPSRMDPNWGNRSLLETNGLGEYHAGYLRVQRKFNNGLLFGVNYTWSATFSDSEEVFNDIGSEPSGGLAGSSPQLPQDFFNRKNEWARSVFDRPHRLGAHYVYQIPWFADSPRILRQAFAGWQVSGFTELQSGSPFTIRVGADTLGAGSSTPGRPDFNPGGVLIKDPATGNLRTFVIPRDGTGIVTAPSVIDPASGNVFFLKNSMPSGGTLGRNTFRGPGFANTNLSLMKRFNLPREAGQLQIRGDFINVFNHDNFANPDTNMSNSTFGTQTFAPLTDARQVLLGAKISF
jgi:hypothetical protein